MPGTLKNRDQSNDKNNDNSSVGTNNKEKKMRNLKECLTMLAAEFVGTFLLVFFGCMGLIDWAQMPGNNDAKTRVHLRKKKYFE